MKRLLRAVAFLGTALVLLHRTPDIVLAGYGCVNATTNPISGACDSCCTTLQVNYNDSFTINGSGFQDLNTSSVSCGSGTTGYCLNQSPSQFCSTSYDSWVLSDDGQCCPSAGGQCVEGNCCYPMVCISGTCQSCTECGTDDDCTNSTEGYLNHCNSFGCCIT